MEMDELLTYVVAIGLPLWLLGEQAVAWWMFRRERSEPARQDAVTPVAPATPAAPTAEVARMRAAVPGVSSKAA